MAVDKKIKYDDKPVVQGGVDNYLGKQPQVVAPRKWKSAPDKPETELAYITKAEKDLILKANIHGGLEDGPNMGPSGIMSLDSFGDIGGGGAAGVDTDPGGGYDTGPRGGGFTGQGPNESDTAFDFRKMNQKELLQNAEKIQAQNLGIRERRNISDFKPRNNFFSRTIGAGLDYARRNPQNIALGLIDPAYGALSGLFGFLNSPKMRKKLTGYETQAEYEKARQDRINLKTIKTLENTIQKKYLDKGRSLDQTNLDERLAALKSQMGITPNTADDLRPDLDFSNEPELAFEGIGSLDKGNQDFNYMFDVGKTSNLINATKNKDFDYLGPNFNEGLFMDYQELDQSGIGSLPKFGGTVLEDEFTPARNTGFIEVQDTPQSRDDFFLNAVADATTFPTDDGSGISLMDRSILRNAGYNDNQIKEAFDKGYGEQLIRDIQGPIGGSAFG